jgi:nicotinamide-nucleotide amidase
VSERTTAVVISAGTELTEGIIQDSHIRFLSSELTSMGFSVARGVLLPDDPAIFAAELERAAAQAGLILITGGLGPTTDDLARETVAGAAGVPLEFHPEVWAALQERFRGRPLAESNRKQAMAPRGFPLIANPNGTAPGFHGRVGEALVVAMPGPPSELRPMFTDSVVPLLEESFGLRGTGDILWGTALLVPESNLEQSLRSLGARGVSWGTRVDEDRIVFSLRGGAAAERERLFTDLAARLGDVRVRRGDTRPAGLLMDALAASGKTLVTAESCTGGLLAKWMTDIPGSSRVYWGGTVVYANQAKTALLGVSPALIAEQGAVSEGCVRAMAAGSLERSGADLAVAVSGVAGPDGGTAERPVGTVWAATALRGAEPRAMIFRYPGARDMVRRRSAVAAFLLAEAALTGKDFLDTFAKW